MSFDKIKFLCLTNFVLLSALALPPQALAETGAIRGTFQFWNGNGNFCPTSNACVGSLYPQALFNIEQPVSNATVWIVDGANNKIGEGRTGDDGSFLVGWEATPAPAEFEAVILPFQAEGRFFFANTDGQLINNGSGFAPLQTGTTAGSPQDLGVPRVVGSSLAPDDFYNSYWAAEVLWRGVLGLVGSAVNNFTGIEIRGFADDIPGFLGLQRTSAASGSTKRVQLDAAAGLSPQARVMHELGHIADYIAHPYRGASVYQWAPGAVPPATTAGGAWSQDSAEWAAAAFEEAYATHYGSIAFWAADAETPTTCNIGGGMTCYVPPGGAVTTPDPLSTLEASSFPVGSDNCSTNMMNPEARWPLSAMRYFWDVYDDRDSEGGDTYSAANGEFWQHLAVLAAYPDGTDANQIDEPWDAARTSVTEPDGRGSAAYEANYQTLTGISTALQRTMNCTPP